MYIFWVPFSKAAALGVRFGGAEDDLLAGCYGEKKMEATIGFRM